MLTTANCENPVVTGFGFLLNMGIDTVQTWRGYPPEEGFMNKQVKKNIPSALLDGAVTTAVALVSVTGWPAVGLGVAVRVGIGMATHY